MWKKIVKKLQRKKRAIIVAIVSTAVWSGLGVGTASLLEIDDRTLFCAAALLCAVLWANAVRTIVWAIPGRHFGWYDITIFHYWTPRFLFPWRLFYLYDNGRTALGLIRISNWWRLNRRLGSGANRRWAGLLEILSYEFKPGDRLLVGRAAYKRLPLYQPISVPGGGRHCILTGAPGVGKSLHLGAMIGSLHPSAGAFIIDSNAAFVNDFGAALQSQGHRVVKIDPDRLAKGFTEAGQWNPLEELTAADKRHGRASVVTFADRLSNALIIQDSHTQPIFANTARIFLKSLLLHVWLCREDRTLMEVRKLLTMGMPELMKDPDKEDPFDLLLATMMALPERYDKRQFDDGCNGAICAAIAGGASVMRMRRGVKENPFKTTVLSQTAWMDDPNIRSVMGRSDMNGEDLKLTNTCVFICATLGDIQSRIAPFLRAFFVMTTYAFERMPEKELSIPTMFVIDEAPSIKIESLPKAAAGYRQFGVRLIVATQSITLLRSAYPEEWRDLYSTSQVALWFGLDDTGDTLKFLSEDMLGLCLQRERVAGTPWYAFWVPKGSRVASHFQNIERLLLDARQCAEFLDPAGGNIIVTRFGRRPMRLKQLRPFIDLPVWRMAASLRHNEAWPRAWFRNLLGRFMSVYRSKHPPTPPPIAQPSPSV